MCREKKIQHPLLFCNNIGINTIKNIKQNIYSFTPFLKIKKEKQKLVSWRRKAFEKVNSTRPQPNINSDMHIQSEG